MANGGMARSNSPGGSIDKTNGLVAI